MNKKSLDPAGHLLLAVSNLEKSKIFYKSLFTHLRFKQIRNTKDSVAWVTPEGFGIWIRQAKYAKPRYKHRAPGLHHLCVKAKTKEIVNEIYELIITKGAPVFSQPKPHPEYMPDYYNILFADPDGIKIEVAYY
jgi:glyoxylase I family protein